MLLLTTDGLGTLTAGVIGSVGWAVGPIIGGTFLVRWCRTPRGAMRLVVILCAVTVGFYAVLMLLACPKQKFAGVVTASE